MSKSAQELSAFVSAGVVPFVHGNSFPVFLRNTDQKRLIAQNIRSVVSDIAEAMQTDPAKPFVVVDLGIGEGELASYYLPVLKEKISNLRFLGVDYAQGMIDKCHETLKGLVSDDKDDRLYVGDCFNQPQLPESLNGEKADLVICSHALYYANDVAHAVHLANGLHGEHGIALHIIQSADSNMHQLRHQFSYCDATKRQSSDQQPNCGSHIKAALSHAQQDFVAFQYSPKLSFPKTWQECFGFLEELVGEGKNRDQWPQYAEEVLKPQNLYGDCAETLHLLEFIKRQPLDSSGFLQAAAAIMQMPAGAGAQPYLSIQDEMILASKGNAKAVIENVVSRRRSAA